jgi:hypothetical protein
LRGGDCDFFSDRSPRIIDLLEQSPGVYLGLLFRQFEGWLKKGFNRD